MVTLGKMAFEKFPKRNEQLATQLPWGSVSGRDCGCKGSARGQCGKQERKARMKSVKESIQHLDLVEG